MTAADWLALWGHFATLSLFAIGGAIPMAPDMHRYLVSEQHWLTDQQFNASIALAQAAPGPNVLFVALFGWNLGLNAGGYGSAVLGMALTMLGILLPSSILMMLTSRWGHRNRSWRPVRAFKLGMAPMVVALIVATGWLLSTAHGDAEHDWRLWLLTAIACVLVLKTKIHLLWVLGAGAVLGALGWV